MKSGLDTDCPVSPGYFLYSKFLTAEAFLLAYMQYLKVSLTDGFYTRVFQNVF